MTLVSRVLEEDNVYVYIVVFFVSIVNYLFLLNKSPKTVALNHTILLALTILWLTGFRWVVLQILLGVSGAVVFICCLAGRPAIFVWSLPPQVLSSKLTGLTWQLRTLRVLRGWRWALLVFWKARPDNGLLALLPRCISEYSQRLPRSVKGLEPHKGGDTKWPPQPTLVSVSGM